MRIFAGALLLVTLSGCSILDNIAASAHGPGHLNSTKVYLGNSVVRNVDRRELGRYSCVDRPVLCQQRGEGFDCSCNY